MTTLRDMASRRDQWMTEKTGFNNDTRSLFVNENDVVLFNFVGNGNEGDRFLKAYRAHEFPGVTKAGKPRPSFRWCPIKSGDEGVQCAICEQGVQTKIKERMILWFYVTTILRASMPQPQQGQPQVQLPQVEYQGKVYFREDVNGFMYWKTSAWKESPWATICQLYEIYQGLHNFTAQMTVFGVQLTRKFNIIAIPNSPGLAPELYERAQTECEPIRQLLTEELAVPVHQNPQAIPAQAFGMPQQQAPVGGFAPFQAPGAPAPTTFQPVMTQPAAVQQPVAAVPGMTFTPVAPQPQQTAPATFTPIMTAPTAVRPGEPPTIAQEAPQVMPAVETAPTATPSADENLPLKKMF